MPRQLSVAARAREAVEHVEEVVEDTWEVIEDVIRDGVIDQTERVRLAAVRLTSVDAVVDAARASHLVEERHEFSRMALEASDGSRRFRRAVRDAKFSVIPGGLMNELGPGAA